MPHSEAATITAELPAMGGRGHRPLVEHSARRPGHRDPAPEVLRFVVWIIAFVTILVVAALVVESERPAWFAFLRNTGSAAPASVSTRGTSASGSGVTGTSMKIISNVGGTTYSVPARSFTIAVLSSGPCYVQIKEPPSATGWTYAETLSGSTKPTNFAASGPALVEVQAQAISLTISSGSHVLGVVHNPVLNHSYVFDPES